MSHCIFFFSGGSRDFLMFFVSRSTRVHWKCLCLSADVGVCACIEILGHFLQQQFIHPMARAWAGRPPI